MRRIAGPFWQACLVGDKETLEMYLQDDYAEEIQVYPQEAEGRFAAEALFHEIKGSRTGEKQVGDTCEIWVESCPMQEQDALEYLTMEFVREQEGWKICFYGLEM